MQTVAKNEDLIEWAEKLGEENKKLFLVFGC